MNEQANVPHVMMVVGEPSGDALGSELMAALKVKTEGQIKMTGVGGPLMEAEGIVSLFPLSDTAVMGLREVVPAIPRILRRVREVCDYAVETKPDLVILIDSPDFTDRIGKRLKKMAPELTIVKYVAAQVWASRPWRAKTMGAFVDHLMALLPFEPQFFEQYGLTTTFVGHPVVERASQIKDGEAFRERHNIRSDEILLGVLPGSRSSEVRFVFPHLKEAVRKLAKTRPNLHTVIPAVHHVAERIRSQTDDWPTPLTLIEGSKEKFEAFDAMDFALATSGTVTTELALAGVPTVVAYNVGKLTGLIARFFINIDDITLISIVQGKRIFPEFILGDCTGENLAEAMGKLMDDPDAQERQKKEMAEALVKMGLGQESPSVRAADTVLKLLA
ncbi:MAG: lipid-A-disaccharide synthase [Alphaproteobacteria bacterium]|nr:MAG: lipid-A-disaccharide synthase [Alphaproteobacteria bacterium]